MRESTIYLLSFLLLIGLTNCKPYQVLDCGGEPVTVPKKPEKSYKKFAKTMDANIKATIDVLEKLKIADLESGLETKVNNLREKLDQYSGRTEDILKTSYFALLATPCDKEVRKSHAALLKQMSTESTALATLEANLKKLSNSGNFGGVDETKIEAELTKYQQTKSDSFFDAK